MMISGKQEYKEVPCTSTTGATYMRVPKQRKPNFEAMTFDQRRHIDKLARENAAVRQAVKVMAFALGAALMGLIAALSMILA